MQGFLHRLFFAIPWVWGVNYRLPGSFCRLWHHPPHYSVFLETVRVACTILDRGDDEQR